MKKDYVQSTRKMNLQANLLSLFIVIILLGPYLIINSITLHQLGREIFLNDFWLFLTISLLSAFIHEYLHGVGYYFFGKAKANEMKITAHLKTFSFALECEKPLDKKSFFITLFLPMFTLGIIPYTLGMFLGNLFLIGWGTCMIATSSGDLTLGWLFKTLPHHYILKFQSKTDSFSVYDKQN